MHHCHCHCHFASILARFLARRALVNHPSRRALAPSNFLLPDPWPFSDDAGSLNFSHVFGTSPSHPTSNMPVYIHIKNKSLSSFLSLSLPPFSLLLLFFFPLVLFLFLPLLVRKDLTDYFTSNIVVSLLSFQIRPGIGRDMFVLKINSFPPFFIFVLVSPPPLPLFLFERTWILPIISSRRYRCFKIRPSDPISCRLCSC